MEKQHGNEPTKPPADRKGKRKGDTSGGAALKSPPPPRAFEASSLDLPAARTQSDMDLDLEQQMTDIRKRNAIYSKRKYYKKKMEVERLEGVKGELNESNEQLKAENIRLESLLVEAQRQVSLIESAGSLVGTATAAPPLGEPLHAVAAAQMLHPSRGLALANSAALAGLHGANESSFLAGTLASSDPSASGTFGGHLGLSSASSYPQDSLLAGSLPFSSSSNLPAGDFLRLLRLQQQQLQQQTGLSSFNAAAAISPNVHSLLPGASLSTLHHLQAGAPASQGTSTLSLPGAATTDLSFANQEERRLLQLLASRSQQQSFMDSQRSLLSEQALRSEFASLPLQPQVSLQQQLLEQRLLLQQQQQQRALSSQLGLQGSLGLSSYEGLFPQGMTYGNELATELSLREQQQRQGAIAQRAQDMRPQPYQDLYSSLLQQVSQPEQALPGTAVLEPGLPSSAMDGSTSGSGTGVATTGTQNDNEALVRLVLERQRREREGPS